MIGCDKVGTQPDRSDCHESITKGDLDLGAAWYLGLGIGWCPELAIPSGAGLKVEPARNT